MSAIARVRARRRLQPVRVAVGRCPIRTAAADAARAGRDGVHRIAAARAGAGAAQAQGQGRAARRRRSDAGGGLPGDTRRLGGDAAVSAHRQAVARGRLGRHQLASRSCTIAPSSGARWPRVIARYHQPALVERYIEGREIYVSMLGRRDGGVDLLPLHEIDFSEMPAGRPRIVSFEAKWEETSAEYRGTKPVRCAGLPAEVGGAHRDRRARPRSRRWSCATTAAWTFASRADGTPYVIDVNPNCDLSEAAGGFARAGRAAGLGYDEVIRRIVDLAFQRRTHADTIPIAVRSRAAHRHPLAGSGIPLRGGRRARSSCSTRRSHRLTRATERRLRGARRRRRTTRPTACSGTPASARRR